MFTIPIKFVQPQEPDLVKLHIYEGSDPGGLFYEIDSSSDIGEFPEYIDEFTTTQARDPMDWFAIQWEDNKGAKTELSAPLQGGSKTLIGEIVERVLLRSSELNQALVTEEAESLLEWWKSADPYTLNLDDYTYTQITALADLTMVNTFYALLAERAGSTTDYRAGMISESYSGYPVQSDSSLRNLELRALKRLGIGGSRIASIEKWDHNHEFEICGVKTTFDSSRTLSTRAIITEVIAVRDISESPYPATIPE